MDNYTGLIIFPPPPPPPSSSLYSSSSASYLSINLSSSSNTNTTTSHGLVSEMEIVNNIGSLDLPKSSLDGSEIEKEVVVERSGGSNMRKMGVEKKVKKPRHAFQTRSQVDILDDGYRWRKYGQKAVKNNKFPRSYYRCTHQGCNVKKQVQRLAKDEGVVETTYEGMHSHPIEKPSHDNFDHILAQICNSTLLPSDSISTN